MDVGQVEESGDHVQSETASQGVSSSRNEDSSQNFSTAMPVIEKLALLDAARKNERDKRKEEAADASDPRENVQAWLAKFTATMSDIKKGIEDAEAARGEIEIESAKWQPQLDGLSLSLFQLEQSIAEASYFLPMYDQKQCSATIALGRKRVEGLKSLALPQKKFTFSRKVNRVVSSSVQAPAPPSEHPTQSVEVAGRVPGGGQVHGAVTEQDLDMVKAGRGLMGLKGETVVYSAEKLQSQDFVLINLEDCEIYLLGQMQALRMQGLRNTKVYTGPVTGACFVNGAESCLFVLATYQARIHNTCNSDFYLRIKSKPIIEHSSALRFAPYCLHDSQVQAQLAQHGLAEETGMFSQVDDFGWIKAVQSPHWCVLPEAERIEDIKSPTPAQAGQ